MIYCCIRQKHGFEPIIRLSSVHARSIFTINQWKGIIEDVEVDISMLLPEVREEEIEDPSDIRDEENIPQQSAMSD